MNNRETMALTTDVKKIGKININKTVIIQMQMGIILLEADEKLLFFFPFQRSLAYVSTDTSRR